MCDFCDKIFKQLHDGYEFHVVVRQDSQYTTYTPIRNLKDVSFVIDDNHACNGHGSTHYHRFEWKFCPVCANSLFGDDKNKIEPVKSFEDVVKREG